MFICNVCCHNNYGNISHVLLQMPVGFIQVALFSTMHSKDGHVVKKEVLTLQNFLEFQWVLFLKY